MRDKIREPDKDSHPAAYVREWLNSVTDEHEELSRSQAHLSLKVQLDKAASRSHRSPSPRAQAPGNQIANYHAGTAPADDSNSLSLPSAGSPTASQKYARRRRHKTRPERYDYKPETSADNKRSTKARGKRRHAHKADRATLNQDFKAPNVESERLTLKHGSMPGFLAKGRASEATDRRGLPDLTFSEMAFLGKKRQLDEARFRGIQTMTTKGKERGGAREISGYFDDVDADGHKDNGTGDQAGAQSGGGSHAASDKQPSQRPAYEPDISGGATHRPPSRGRLRGPTHDKEEVYASPGAENRPLPISLPAPTATSVSWSTSPPRKVANVFQQKYNLGYAHEIPQQPNDAPFVLHAARTIYPRSSVSNPTAIRRHNECTANTAPERQYGHAAIEKRRYYSLDDLKQLADTVYPFSTQSETRKEPEYTEEIVRRSEQISGKRADDRVKGVPAVDSREMTFYSAHDFDQGRALTRAMLAQADPALMPHPESASEERYRVPPTHTSPHTPMTIDEVMARHRIVPGLKRSGLEGSNWTGLHNHGQYANCGSVGSERVTEECSPGELDEFDTDLLRSIGRSTSHSRTWTRVVEACTKPAQLRRPPADDLAPARASSVRRVISDTITSNIDPWTHDAKLQDRAQLLRPSQQGGEQSAPFASFKRPRLLY